MPVTINADTVTGAAVVTADASGVLALQAAGNTGLTLNSSQAIGVGASPSFGTAGQVLTSSGSGAAPTWTNLPAGSEIIRVARTSNTALTSANRGNLIDITGGTFTQTFDACASLGNGWFCYLDNSGTGDITLDPNGSETIDGLTSYIMYPGEVRLVQCDGTALRTIVLNAFYRTFTTSGTFTKPPGYSAYQVALWGGGGGGGKSGDIFAAGGGGGGACNFVLVQPATLSTSTSFTIGAGGVGRTGVADGGGGGQSSFGSLFSAFGGGSGGGVAGENRIGGGGGGIFEQGISGGQFSTGYGGSPHTIISGNAFRDDPGFGGANGGNNTGGQATFGGGGGGAGNSGAGGLSIYGGGGGGGGGNVSNAGGASTFGGAGGTGNNTTSGTDGTAPGGGGGATRTGPTSGAGARGELRIWGVI